AQPPRAHARRRGGGRGLPPHGRDDARRGRPDARLFPPAGGLPLGACPAIAGTPGAERMITRVADGFWPACLSALHLDGFLAGELDELGERRVRQHLLAGSRCAGAVEAMRAVRDEPLPPLRVVPLRPSARRWPRAATAGVALAAAASLLLLVRAPGERVKG